MPFAAEINQLNTDIVAVSFGTPYWANAWLEETQAPFPIWLDPKKETYELYGMTSSALRSWGIKNLAYYAQAYWRGEKSKGNRGDTSQMGGNFIIDKNGIVRFAYPSKDPTDRPEISKLLATLKTLD
ncbi:MAG: AhpC/TSA family protein [Anaerolineae bacterium]